MSRPPAICKDCKKREECGELCERAEKYVPPVLWGRLGVDKINGINPLRVKGLITPPHSFLIFRMFFFERKTQRKIAEILGVSQPYVSKVLKKIREEILRKHPDFGYTAVNK